MLRIFIAYVFIAAAAAGFSVVAMDAPRALVSEILMRHAWAVTLDGKAQARAWPWIKSWPVAELTIERPGKNGMQQMIVMSGSSPDVLAFAPLWHDGTEKPGTPGIALISGDRRTHFDFLKALGPGDAFGLRVPGQELLSYVIEEVRIIEDSAVTVRDTEKDSVVILSADYPGLDGPEGSGMRLIVIARARTAADGLQVAVAE